MSKVSASDGTGTKEVLLKLCCRPSGISQSRRPLTMPSRLDLTPEEKAERHRQQQREKNKRYRMKHADRLKEKQANSTEEQKARRREAQRRYQERNIEKIRKMDRLRRDTRAEYFQMYAEKNSNNPDYIERRRAKQRRYQKTEKGKATAARFLQSEKGKALSRAIGIRRRQRVRSGTLAPQPIKARLLTNELYAAANAVVPSSLPEFVRDDIIADICLAVLSGEFSIDDIPKSAKPIVAKGRQSISKFGLVSLDAPRFDDGKRTLHDTISVGLWNDGSDEEVEAQP